MTVLTYASAQRMHVIRVRQDAGSRWWLLSTHRPSVVGGFTFWTTDAGIVRA